jgi:hypothetical protein
MKYLALVVYFILLSQSFASECMRFQKSQLRSDLYHKQYVEQYETEITWDVDWDNYYEGEFNFALENACEQVDKINFHYELFNPYEFVAIYQYTRHLYSHLNSRLRSNQDIEKIQLIIDALDSALSKFPKFTGQVKRGSFLPKEIDQLYFVDNTVSDNAYVSTSKLTAKPQTKYHERPFQFLITTCNGRDISNFSAFSDEQEVLIPRGNKFKVLSRSQDEKQTFLTLHELNDQDELCNQ